MHPDIRQALANAHIEDLQREAARRQAIRLARRVAEDERPSSLMQTFLRLGVARVRRLQVRLR
jgi:hypothetical protein